MHKFREAVRSALLVVSLLATDSALGQGAPRDSDEPQAFRVEFAAPEGCGDGERFSEEILKRTDRLRPAENHEAALGFFVHLTRTADGVRGQFAIRDIDGALTLREVPGHDCPEVLSAMALIAALTVDPLARADRELPIATRRKLPKPEPAPRRAPAPRPPPREPEAPEEPASAGFGFAAGQRVTLQTAVMPGITFGLGAYVEAASKATTLLAPLIRVAALLSQSGAIEEPTGTAEFDWITARVSVCPVRFGSERGVSARPCAFFDAGRLHGAGSNITPNREKSVFWTAGGAEVTAALHLIGPLVAGADAGILVPIRRDRFIFEPDDEIHQIPAVGFSAGLGLGLLFF